MSDVKYTPHNPSQLKQEKLMESRFEPYDWNELQYFRELYRRMMRDATPTVPNDLLLRLNDPERKYADAINSIVECWEAMTRGENCWCWPYFDAQGFRQSITLLLTPK